jgi:hypothetical protein
LHSPLPLSFPRSGAAPRVMRGCSFAVPLIAPTPLPRALQFRCACAYWEPSAPSRFRDIASQSFPAKMHPFLFVYLARSFHHMENTNLFYPCFLPSFVFDYFYESYQLSVIPVRRRSVVLKRKLAVATPIALKNGNSFLPPSTVYLCSS